MSEEIAACLNWWAEVKHLTDSKTEMCQVHQIENFYPKSFTDFVPRSKYYLRSRMWSTDNEVHRYRVYIGRIAETREQLAESVVKSRVRYPVLQPTESDFLASDSEQERRKRKEESSKTAVKDFAKLRRKAAEGDLDEFLAAMPCPERSQSVASVTKVTRVTPRHKMTSSAGKSTCSSGAQSSSNKRSSWININSVNQSFPITKPTPPKNLVKKSKSSQSNKPKATSDSISLSSSSKINAVANVHPKLKSPPSSRVHPSTDFSNHKQGHSTSALQGSRLTLLEPLPCLSNARNSSDSDNISCLQSSLDQIEIPNDFHDVNLDIENLPFAVAGADGVVTLCPSDLEKDDKEKKIIALEKTIAQLQDQLKAAKGLTKEENLSKQFYQLENRLFSKLDGRLKELEGIESRVQRVVEESLCKIQASAAPRHFSNVQTERSCDEAKSALTVNMSTDSGADRLSITKSRKGQERVNLGSGVLCRIPSYKILTSTMEFDVWCSALLVGVYGEAAREYGLNPRPPKKKFSSSFKDIAKCHYSLFLDRIKYKGMRDKKAYTNMIRKLSDKARDLGGRRNRKNKNVQQKKGNKQDKISDTYIVDPQTGRRLKSSVILDPKTGEAFMAEESEDEVEENYDEEEENDVEDGHDDDDDDINDTEDEEDVENEEENATMYNLYPNVVIQQSSLSEEDSSD